MPMSSGIVRDRLGIHGVLARPLFYWLIKVWKLHSHARSSQAHSAGDVQVHSGTNDSVHLFANRSAMY